MKQHPQMNQDSAQAEAQRAEINGSGYSAGYDYMHPAIAKAIEQKREEWLHQMLWCALSACDATDGTMRARAVDALRPVAVKVAAQGDLDALRSILYRATAQDLEAALEALRPIALEAMSRPIER